MNEQHIKKIIREEIEDLDNLKLRLSKIDALNMLAHGRDAMKMQGTLITPAQAAAIVQLYGKMKKPNKVRFQKLPFSKMLAILNKLKKQLQ